MWEDAGYPFASMKKGWSILQQSSGLRSVRFTYMGLVNSTEVELGCPTIFQCLPCDGALPREADVVGLTRAGIIEHLLALCIASLIFH